MIDGPGYDEFGLFHENADRGRTGMAGPPTVERVAVDLGDGRSLSALRWGSDAPEIVLVHGGGQNAHTWDTVALALGRPLLAVDLPGHGHSGDVHPERPPSPQSLRHRRGRRRRGAGTRRRPGGRHVPRRTHLGAGGRRPPALVRKLMLVDVTPGAGGEKTADIVKFLVRARDLRQPRRDPRAHHRLQPHPQRVVASPRRAPQHRAARRRHVGVASPAAPAAVPASD